MADTKDVKDKMDMVNPMAGISKLSWTVVLGLGAGLLILGILMMVYPEPTLTIVVWLIGAAALFFGIFAVISFFTAKAEEKNLGWLMLGLVGIAFGIIILVYPDMTVKFLMFLWGLWLIITGIVMLFAGLMAKDMKDTRWLMVLGGILSLVVGSIFVLNPYDGAVVLIWVIGLFTLIYGIIFVVLGIRLHSAESKAAVPAKK
jgi:uncharacterized membrane protein HdeD (DUF308 family)